MTKHAQSHFVRGDISGLLIAFFLLIYCLKGRSPAPQGRQADRLAECFCLKGEARSSSEKLLKSRLWRDAHLFLPYFQKTESVCQFISGTMLPLPRRNGLLMGHFLITAILLLFKKNHK